ncbi:Uncharacterised protein [Mycobacteroides abscessus subsp. abscessus]|nr:Uncharacterised protein [Mycobacteroides abscessus subsp. abscessus]
MRRCQRALGSLVVEIMSGLVGQIAIVAHDFDEREPRELFVWGGQTQAL